MTVKNELTGFKRAFGVPEPDWSFRSLGFPWQAPYVSLCRELAYNGLLEFGSLGRATDTNWKNAAIE